jgi:hypothetical protein
MRKGFWIGGALAALAVAACAQPQPYRGEH